MYSKHWQCTCSRLYNSICIYTPNAGLPTCHPWTLSGEDAAQLFFACPGWWLLWCGWPWIDLSVPRVCYQAFHGPWHLEAGCGHWRWSETAHQTRHDLWAWQTFGAFVLSLHKSPDEDRVFGHFDTLVECAEPLVATKWFPHPVPQQHMRSFGLPCKLMHVLVIYIYTVRFEACVPRMDVLQRETKGWFGGFKRLPVHVIFNPRLVYGCVLNALNMLVLQRATI